MICRVIMMSYVACLGDLVRNLDFIEQWEALEGL